MCLLQENACQEDKTRDIIVGLVGRCPHFQINGDAVCVLDAPGQFLSRLKKQISGSCKRVIIAALYLGTDEEEQVLVDTLREAVVKNKDLRVTLLFDRTRSLRCSKDALYKSTLHLLFPLVKSHPDRVVAYFYQTPLLTPLLQKWLPSRFQEVVGVQHLKVFIGDEDIILSGANLSDQYFTNRQDRYVQFRGCPGLTDWYARLVTAVCRFSYPMCPRRIGFLLPLATSIDPTGNPSGFKAFARDQLLPLLSPMPPNPMDADLDTWEIICTWLLHTSTSPGAICPFS